jgi:hypothetical protein
VLLSASLSHPAARRRTTAKPGAEAEYVAERPRAARGFPISRFPPQFWLI